MRPSLKDQGSQNANRWAQQRKEQLERSRQSSREKTNFASLGEQTITRDRGNSQQKKNVTSQERQKIPLPTQQKFKPTPSISNQTTTTSYQEPFRQHSYNQIPELPVYNNPQKPPQQQNISEASNQLRQLKHKMSMGSTNSRLGTRGQVPQDEYQDVKETAKISQHQKFTQRKEWDDTPSNINSDIQEVDQFQLRDQQYAKQIKTQKSQDKFEQNNFEPLPKISKQTSLNNDQPKIPPRNNRTNTYKDNKDNEDNGYQGSKKPPIQVPQKKNQNISSDQDVYQQKQSSKINKPDVKPSVKSSIGSNKKVEYHNYNSNPFNYENPFDEEPAIATGVQEIQIPMYADPNDEYQELRDCPEGCGRRFNEKAFDNHVKICQKVFQTKRKQFNTKEHRILDSEHATLQNQVATKLKQDQQKQKKSSKIPVEDKPLVVQKKAKWLAQSEALRAGLKGASGQQLSKEENAAIVQAQNSDLIQCSNCGRRFNETAAKKHISFCEMKAKQNKMKQAPQKPYQSNNKNYK